jgi:hypothetical protein
MKVAKKPVATGTRWLLISSLGLTLSAGACATDVDSTGEPSSATTAGAATTPTETASTSLAPIANSAYDLAVHDLVGINPNASSTFPAPGDAFATESNFERYFNAADTIGEQVFADPSLKARLLTCLPGADAACTRQLVTQIGTRAWKTEMQTAEIDRLTQVATDAVALGETPSDSIKQVVKTVLASPQFLYRVEAAQQTSL